MAGNSRNYRDLIAWQKAMGFVREVYQATRGFPREEIYGLTSQLRRAAVSIPSNIAEGEGRDSANEFRQFLTIAYGSIRECETQILIAQDLGYADESATGKLLNQAAEVGRLINGLKKSLQSPNRKR